MVNLFNFSDWKQRVSAIRSGHDRAHCLGNLSLALSEVGPLGSAGAGSAAGALTLLPTAGALIGAPAKEIWVLYKLMPIAGVLSMLLSLGGNIVPTQSSDYEFKTAWGWTLFWYTTVAISSILENVAGVPFTRQWTLRISKAPKNIHISEDAPVVASCITKATKTTDSTKRPIVTTTPNPNFADPNPLSPDTVAKTAISTPLLVSQPHSDLLINLKAGYNTTGRVVMDPNKPWSASRAAFYVIISVEGISTPHAILRVISKAISVGVFAAGTATFASATFISVSVALTMLCMVLGVGVFGRVATMWMASKMMKADPILHCVVKDQDEAADYVGSILSMPDLTCEVMGHVIVNGRCVGRYNRFFRNTTYFGILAPPYDVSKLAVSRQWAQ
ncbi:hypothetical protein GP486_005299 [Trichoglossum hirsutum]|uniref:Uncharacterized protein n=1 Tax=Trichoglossum hirsutum TaxID=265104 RepID=A0A9P8L9E9_9PEZI|nr:hypothetical protein GP486_005299 [Trichoglossum hirsutum]